MKTPLEAFIEWFDTVPLPVRETLAHIFQVATTEDTSLMAVSRERSLERFRHWAIRRDFPMRIAARMFHIRAVFDMVIIHHRELAPEQGIGAALGLSSKIVNISSRHWNTVPGSWKKLRGEELSETYIHSWTAWMINLQLETT